MKALLLCAGYGKRLGNLTRDTPKSLLPVAGQPLLFYALRYLVHFGFDEVAINLHYRAEQIVAAVGDGAGFGVDVHYAYEDSLLGTAGAVKNLEDFFAGCGDFLVVYGDLLIDQDLSAMLAFHRETQGTVTLLLHQRVGSNSLVRMGPDRRITGFVERPTEAQRSECSYPWVNSGVHLCQDGILEHIPKGVSVDFPKDIFAKPCDAISLYGFPLTGYRCAIDSPERYREAEVALREGRCRIFKDSVRK
jgi:mannose-1-phosphate guanylyltransferase/phosphomannomutase